MSEASRIVSSQHLVSPKSPELSEFEFGMIIAWHAFARWMVRCMAATGVKDMTPIDVLVLHHDARPREWLGLGLALAGIFVAGMKRRPIPEPIA